MDNIRNSFFMCPQSGIVMHGTEWIEEWKQMDPELWGGSRFEDAGLIEVVYHADIGAWQEA